MAKQQKSANLTVNTGLIAKRLNKDTHPSSLEPGEYTHAMNTNTENESGDSINRTNEKSNVLSTRFKPGFRVHGVANDIDSDTTFFFLVNPETGVGEFGEIQNNKNTNDLEDLLINCTDCDKKYELAEPLEDIEQTPLQTYETLMSDACKESPAEGFNFNVNYPIKSIVIKNEKTGKKIYFTDGYNSPRYINYTRLQDYFIDQVPCSADVPVECPDFDELRQFKLFKFPNLIPSSIELGGRLPMGTYEFLLAYADGSGNEISPYYAITQPIAIFDKNNRVLEQANLADRTNFAIRLDVSGLDQRYSHYKVAVIQTADVEGATRYFEEGLHPINDTTVIYTTEQNKIATSIDALLRPSLHVLTSEAVMASNNILFQTGITQQQEMNLQPVVNLLGEFVQWQTSVAQENLYDNGVQSAKFAGYNRDETEPLGIRFLQEGGYETAIFPLVGRAPKEDDLIEVAELAEEGYVAKEGPHQEDVDSILSNINQCNTTNRIYKWQYYNTSQEDQTNPECSTTGLNTVIVEEITPKTCVIEAAATIPAGTISINTTDVTFTNLEDYINLNKDDCPAAFEGTSICAYLTADYSGINCSVDPYAILDCTDIIKEEETIEVSEVIGETQTYIPKIYPTEYVKIAPPSSCTIYKVGRSAGYQEDDSEPLGQENDVFIRDSDFLNENPNYAKDIVQAANLAPNDNPRHFNNYYVSTDATKTSLLGTKNAAVTDGDFNTKLHKGALWFRMDFLLQDYWILDLSKQKDSEGDDKLPVSNRIRLNMFKKATDTTAVYGAFVDLNVGGIFLLKKNSTTATTLDIVNELGTTVSIPNAWNSSREVFFTVDCPITEEHVILSGSPTEVIRYLVRPMDGCYTFTKRPREFSRVDVSWDNIIVDKKIKYSATCTFERPSVNACTAVPFKKGDFAYTESTETYPDNPELFDSSTLEIPVSLIPTSIKSKFEEVFTTGQLEGKYLLNPDTTNLTCKPIRHFRFPDNRVAPFTTNMANVLPFSSSLIYPLGITIDESLINTFLDLAVYNNLISESDRSKITGYEIFRGDVSLERSVLASGMLFDLRRYKENDKPVYYSNYPFNTYSNDVLNKDEEYTTTDGRGGKFGDKGRNYTFHSPETDYYRPSLPSEMSIQGYMFGQSRGHFDEVKEHPKWVILSDKARNLASTLATLECVAETIIESSQALSNAQVQFGVVFNTGAPAFIATALIAATGAASAIVYKYGRYRYQWLKIFRDLGQPNNFAYYYYGEGYYNYMRNLQTAGTSLRGLNIAKYLKDGRYTTSNEVTGEKLTINNIDREASVLLSLGDKTLEYDAEYADYDKASTESSLTYSSKAGFADVGRSREVIRQVASPYVALKNYLPSQYGTLNSIKWLTTSYRGDLKNPKSSCVSIFGGDTYITRHTLKRKIPLFLTTAMKQADLTPFNYFYYSNIGKNPLFYCSYETTKDFSSSGQLFPELTSDFSFDSKTSQSNYFVPPSKFYLYYYGVPNFLCETRINTNYRYAGKEPERNYYPLVGDLGQWTQESAVSIRQPNVYLYNSVYSKQVTRSRYRTLADNYSKELYSTLQNMPNGAIASLPDNTENSLYDPWLIYRPLDTWEFPSNYGKLKDLIDIESQAILARFENTSVLFNKVDTKVDDGQQVTQSFLGGNSFFQRRTSSFHNTKLGYGGTQNSAYVSCEYGHFYVDAKRGQVIQVPPNGDSMQEISSTIGGRPSGMRNWFKEHLPFKILKHIKNADVDNVYNGVGISMGWDSRHRRVFITKKDYLPLNPEIVFVEGEGYKLGETTVELNNTQYFKDVSWTIAYDPVNGGWLSYYSFKPNYYISHNTYFQTGLNLPAEESEFGLWSHLLTNKSFQVFYGKKYPFSLEYAVKDEYMTKTLYNVHLWTEAKRYRNEYDYSSDIGLVFNKSLIYNNVSCSGNLNLIAEPNRLANSSKYPKTNTNGTQDIMITNSDRFRWSYNYFYNRVKNNTSNIPFILKDENQIEIQTNPDIVSFKGKPVLERLTGNYFLNRITYDKDSRFGITFKFTSSQSEI